MRWVLLVTAMLPSLANDQNQNVQDISVDFHTIDAYVRNNKVVLCISDCRQNNVVGFLQLKYRDPMWLNNVLSFYCRNTMRKSPKNIKGSAFTHCFVGHRHHHGNCSVTCYLLRCTCCNSQCVTPSKCRQTNQCREKLRLMA